MISDLTPETEYGVQVCQPELGVCGNCEVTFSTPAAQGTYIYYIYIYMYIQYIIHNVKHKVLETWTIQRFNCANYGYSVHISKDGLHNSLIIGVEPGPMC